MAKSIKFPRAKKTVTSGALHHHINWEPLSDNGFVEVV